MNAPIRVNSFLRIMLVLLIFQSRIQAQVSPPPAVADQFAHTFVGKEVVLNVASDNATLDKIVLTNHGSARIENNKIIYTPAAGFAGVGYVNYTLCDNTGTNCNTGLITIDVAQPQQPPAQYQNLFSKNYGAITFTLPKGYILNQDQSTLGSSTLKETTEGSGIWEFSANNNTATKVEAVLYRYVPGNYSQFYVTIYILKAPALQVYTKNDMKYTLRSKPIFFNVLENDKKEDIKEVIVLESNDGIVKNYGDGNISFTPHTITRGPVDLYYQVVTKDNKTEVAKATVLVSNFEPDVTENVQVFATRGKPLILPYNIPNNRFEFSTLGDTSRHGGTVDFKSVYEHYIDGQLVRANNVIVYTPPQKPNIKIDAFTAFYKLTETGEEFAGQNVIVFLTDDIQTCYADCLWPGDVNTDGVVNVKDLYILSKHLGAYGIVRSNNDLSWKGQPAPDWQVSDNTINLKYADTNGDGILSEKDVDAIVRNFEAKNTIQPVELMNEDYEVKILNSNTVTYGDKLELGVSVGGQDAPIIDALGLSFDIDYTSTTVQQGTVNMSFDNESWMARYDSHLWLSKDMSDGSAYAALSRTKERGASGHGVVGKLNAVVIEDIAGFRLNDNPVIRIKLTNIKLLGKDGQITRIPDTEISIPIQSKKGAENEPLKNEDLKVYPNPATDAVNFHLNGVNNIDYIRIMDVSGREVSRVNNVSGKQATVSTSSLARGLYFTEVMTAKGRVVKKLEILK